MKRTTCQKPFRKRSLRALAVTLALAALATYPAPARADTPEPQARETTAAAQPTLPPLTFASPARPAAARSRKQLELLRGVRLLGGHVKPKMFRDREGNRAPGFWWTRRF